MEKSKGMKTMEEILQLGSKILGEFNKDYAALPFVDEIGIIFTNEERSPTPIHTEGNCIGVEKWCVKYLYTYAYHEFMTLSLESDHEQVDELSRCVVLFCPDCATAWNMRKQTLLKSSLSLLRDLQLSRLALRLHPKSTEAFAHRRWILKKLFPAMFSSNLHNAAAPKNTCADSHVRVVQEHLPEHTEHQWHLLHEETKLCEKAAGWHRSNYNAWNHRLWIAKKLAIKPLVHFACENTIAIFVKHLCTELDTTMAWIERNVSDHSGMAFCQQVLCDLAKFCMTENRLSNEDLLASVQTNVLCYWTRALVQCDELLTLHDGRHEALWMHRYELVLSFHQLLGVENTALKCQDETHGNAAKLFSFSKCVSFCKMFTEKNIGDCDGLPACRRHLSFLEKVLPYVVHSRPKNA